MAFEPNTTPTPNWLYNGEMRKMSDTELRVVLMVTRYTLGWIIDKDTGQRKREDWISHSQLCEKTGKSSRAVSMAVDNCVKRDWIETRDKKGNILTTPKERRRRKIYYRLGNIFTSKLHKKSTANSMVDKNLPQMTTKSTASTVDKSTASSMEYKRNSYKETIQNTTEQSSEEWSFEKELEKLRDNPRKDLKIIALYWKKKNYSFANKTQFEKALKRELRPAANLTGYSGKEIMAAIDYCEEQYNDRVPWTLETCFKRISDLVNVK